MEKKLNFKKGGIRMSQLKLSAGLVIGLTALAALPVSAGTNTINVEPVEVVTGVAKAQLMVGVESWSGDNTYQIGNPVHWFDGTVDQGYFPFSELAFPLDIAMVTAQANVEFYDTWMFMGSVKKNVTDPDDQMIDKDWITDANPSQLDVYSNSNITDFDGYEFDFSVKYKFLQGENWSLDGGAGYLYQNWQYEASVVRQYSPSGLDGFDYLGDGRPAIRYTLEYNIPYFQVGGKVKLGNKVSLLSRLSYSPWVDAENVDQHMLRYKVNKGDLDGYSWMFKVEGQYDFSEHWFMTASYDYKQMKVDGTMRAEFANFYEYIYGVVPNHTVWEEIESVQHAMAITVGYHF